jgi:hypothetical protein
MKDFTIAAKVGTRLNELTYLDYYCKVKNKFYFRTQKETE